ncbi:MAG TPA: hypothetical protein VMB77_04415, partial [Syntrophales bacterium]|nr:hypothetical protein [Syntrophales bacterium]
MPEQEIEVLAERRRDERQVSRILLGHPERGTQAGHVVRIIAALVKITEAFYQEAAEEPAAVRRRSQSHNQREERVRIQCRVVSIERVVARMSDLFRGF